MTDKPARTPDHHALLGVALTIGAAALWGTTGTAQGLLRESLSPYWVGALRLLIASTFFLLCLGLLRSHPGHRAAWRQLSLRQALFAGCSIASYNLAFFAGVKLVGVAVGTAITIGSAPIWAGLLQLASGRRLPRGWWTGTLLAVAGGALLLAPGSPVRFDISGVLLCLASGLSYALYATVNKLLVQHNDPGLVTMAVFTLAALIALPAAWWVAGPRPGLGLHSWLVMIFLGVAATGVAYLLFSTGQRHINAASAVSLSLMEPVTAFALAVLVIGENPANSAYAGLLLLLSGLGLVIHAEKRRNHDGI